jgi:Putative zinc-finger
VTDTTDRFRDWDAAYVLGALDSEDRRDYERHLVECPNCAAALAELAGLPGILSKLSQEDAVALLSDDDVTIGVDDHLRDGIHTPGLVQRLAVSASRRRRRFRIGMVGAVVAVAALLSVGGVVYGAAQPAAVATVAMTPVGQHAVTAKMTITPKAWGTRFDWSCQYAQTESYGAGQWYDLVVTLRSGQQKTVANWGAGSDAAAGLSASSAIATADIRSVEIRLAGSNATLLREDL